MSLSLLLEKYDVSTDEGLQKALCDIEKEESEVDEALSNALSRAYTLEGRLRTASQAYTKLNEVKNDTQSAAYMVDKTASLAKDVSAKVRQLDLARSRVAECQRRVHDLIDLQSCSAGVEAAILAHDLETGAGHVARFLSMDPGSVAAARARGAPDPRDAMARAANTLREHLVRKFEEAARKDDSAKVERLFKLFPQIGRAEEGVDLLAKYLAAQMEVAIRRASTVSDVNSDAAVFADALTRVLEAAAAAVEKARAAAPTLLPRALKHLQPVICAGARRVYSELVSARRLDPGDPRRAPLSPLAAEPALVELALAHNTVTLYFAYLRRKTEAGAATLAAAGEQAAVDAVEEIIAECDLTRTAQDVLGHYLMLERYFLEENVNKALKMATPQTGVNSSSLVDDIFFIARKAIRRSISTGSVEGVCAVLNEASALVERGATALRRLVRAPAEPLPLPPPPPAPPSAPPSAAAAVLDAAGSLHARLNRDLDAQRDLFLAYTNEAEAGSVWSERLAAEACAAGEALVRRAADRGKLHSCAAGLAGAAAAYAAARDLALDGIHAALKPRIVAWAEYIADPGLDPEDMEEDADALPLALDTLQESARLRLSSRAADAVLLAALTDLATRAEARLLHHHYEREGGLIVERRARRFASWAGGNLPAARERLARLTQAAALLALERPSHARDALRPAPRLTAPHTRDILARRTDFKIEEIKRLKL